MQYLVHLASYVWHWFCLFVCLLDLCLSLGLSVCWTYVCHWVCLFVGRMFGIGFVSLLVLCLALGLSVCWTYVFQWLGYLEQAQLINCFWNIW